MGGLMIAIAEGALAVSLFAQSGSRREVAASDPPRVVATSPAQGAVIDPGPHTLSVTFDRAVAPQNYSYVQADEGPVPECDGNPSLSADGRTYSSVRPGRACAT